ncbi:MAG TPA: glycosyltransferase family 1 protein [Stellaceae bacterium]|nr:glycosyltransferase family 1 protein [Stellaceae bacterium]
MSRRIYYDGLNLQLEHGTGIATYTRLLARIAHDLGHEVGVVYSSLQRPAKNPLLREIALFDNQEAPSILTPARWGALPKYALGIVADQLRAPFGVQPSAVTLSGAVVTEQFQARLALRDHLFLARNLFANARRYFSWSGRFIDLAFDTAPDILHCTYQMPLRAKAARNIYTIHDLVPLRLPYTTLDNKRLTYRLLRKIAAEADHIVTVSENSKRDIVQLLGVDAGRVTNTYEAVEFPRELIERPDDLVAEQLYGTYQLGLQDYLLFYGALEPKKNIARLIDAYLLSAVDVPLVITGAVGWGNRAEARMLKELQNRFHGSPRIHHFEYVSSPMLVTLIRGARAVVFPSLYEGFGLPVLEAMALGTPVVTSRTSSLPEIAGDAALYVNPFDIDDIARALKTIAADDGLRAELSKRGRVQAELFSVARYRERVGALYDRLA